ncbi:hypothetical protein GCK32_001666 [Trichostrongylus colubriformis]|uniref:Uncharacterized protein n=1 Tax=Trichostrongylus colubriformis TaxID=6319 RepID=A0AAN8IVA3_TRICO
MNKSDKSVIEGSKKLFNLNKTQADAIRERVQKKRDARELAREEERNYVEFRKMEILYQFRPKTTATTKNPDDSFPRRKRGVSMGFGERKAYFLSIRPNPKFATWFGKKKRSAASTNRDDNKNKILLPVAPVPEKSLPPEIPEEDELEDSKSTSVKKGINAANPFIKGCPFWTVSTGDEEEMAEDDYPVDIEAIEKVVNGAALKRPPFLKKSFDIHSDLDTFKKDDVLFDRELIFGNTVTTVLNLFCTDQNEGRETKKGKTPHRGKSSKSQKSQVSTISEIQNMVTWANTITITTFEVEKREPKKKRVPQEEPMKDIKRMSGEAASKE